MPQLSCRLSWLTQVFLTRTHLAIAMEYAPGGDLYQHVIARKPFCRLPEDQARWLFQQLLIGLDYCHRKVYQSACVLHLKQLLACASACRLPATLLRQMLGMVIAGALDIFGYSLISAMTVRQAMVTWKCLCLLGKLVMVTWNPSLLYGHHGQRALGDLVYGPCTGSGQS